MDELEDSFAKLLGRQPTDEERQQLYKIRDALTLKNNDALWLVLMALQYHQTMYARFPDLIKQAAAETLLQFQQTATITLAATKESTKAELAKAVAATARDVARLAVARQTAVSIAFCLMVCGISFCAFGWSVHKSAFKAGYDKGYAAAYLDAKDEKVASAWGNTTQGKAAYQLAKAGSIESLIRCDQPGWKIVQGVCYVHPISDGSIYGWRIR